MENTTTDAEFLAAFKSTGYSLLNHHGIFYRLFDISQIRINREIPSITVGLSKINQQLELSVNPDYFLALTPEQRKFIVCHEMFHLIMGHIYEDFGDRVTLLNNCAKDLVVNEALTAELGFNRAEIDPNNEFCWYDTLFPEELVKDKYPKGVPTGRSSDYYYHVLKELYPDLKNPPNSAQGQVAKGSMGSQSSDSNSGDPEDNQNENSPTSGGGNKSPDTHDWDKPSDGDGEGDSKDNRDSQQQTKKLVQDAIDKLSPEEQEALKKSASWGSEPGTQKYNLKNKRVKPDHRFRKVIRQITGARKQDNGYTWTREDMRLTGNLADGSVRLPAKGLTEIKNKKPEVWLFMDVSGSCIHLKNDFWDAALSVPRSLFNVRTFIFDTQVREVKDKSFQGGGGTSFHAIESFLLKQDSYPKYIWVITDGEAGKPSLKYEDRWYWFLDGYSYYGTQAIPSNCKAFDLKTIKKLNLK